MTRRRRPLGSRRARLVAAGGALGCAAVVAVLVLALGPGIDRAKRAQAQAAARLQARTLAALIARERRDQVLHEEVVDFASAPSGPAALQRALERDLERAIFSDARARARAGTLSGPVLSVSCGAYAAAARSPARIGSFACLAVTGLVRRRAGGAVAGYVGIPFWARIDFAHDRLAWCRITPRPGEMAYGRAPAVPLSPVCDLTRPAPGGW